MKTKYCQRIGIEIPGKKSHRIFRKSLVANGSFLYHFRSWCREAGLAVAEYLGLDSVLWTSV
jgi:hypothetical protein